MDERPPFVAWAARALERDPADVIAWADTDTEVVLVFRQGDKRRVPHAQAEAQRDDLSPTDGSEVDPLSVAAETANDSVPLPIEASPAAEPDLIEEPLVVSEPPAPVVDEEPTAKPKTTRRGGR